MGMKAVVWVVWTIHTLVGIVYLGLAVATGNNIRRVDQYIQGGSSTNAFKNGLMASVVLGFIMVLFFMVWSLIVLLAKRFTDMHLSYGIMLGTCIHTAWFMLLAGLVLNASSDLAENLANPPGGGYALWSQTDYTTYTATYGFSYILVGTFIVLFITLLFGRNAMSKEAAYAAQAAKSAASQVEAPGRGTSV